MISPVTCHSPVMGDPLLSAPFRSGHCDSDWEFLNQDTAEQVPSFIWSTVCFKLWTGISPFWILMFSPQCTETAKAAKWKQNLKGEDTYKTNCFDLIWKEKSGIWYLFFQLGLFFPGDYQYHGSKSWWSSVISWDKQDSVMLPHPLEV